MFERQYRDFRSGVAKERFNKDLAEMKAKAGAPIVVERPVVEMPKFKVEDYVERYPKATPVQSPVKGQLLWEVDVDNDSKAMRAISLLICHDASSSTSWPRTWVLAFSMGTAVARR